MDNGQNQGIANPNFANMNPGEVNSWDVTPERNPATIGNRVMNSGANLQPNMENPANAKLGEIVNLDPKIDATPTPSPVQDFDPSVFVTSEHLNPAAINEVRKAESELSRGGDAASYYEKIRSMTEANLQNSYGRKAA